MIIKKEIQEYFNKRLNLPATGTEQDWHIEMSDPNRIKEFIKIYNEEIYPNDEYQMALIALILSSLEESLYTNPSLEVWNEIKPILLSKRNLLNEVLGDWTLEGQDDKAYWFRITPLAREIKGFDLTG